MNAEQFEEMKKKIIEELWSKLQIKRPESENFEKASITSEENPFGSMSEFQKLVHNKVRKYISDCQMKGKYFILILTNSKCCIFSE